LSQVDLGFRGGIWCGSKVGSGVGRRDSKAWSFADTAS
jgi:hypothetical protein